MSTETTPYIPPSLQKLNAVCEKLRLVYWLYNNDGNGCGPIQGIPITFFGDWTMDEFYCDGVNILPDPVAISYSNWNDNFNEWTGELNPLSAHHWDWINAGRPCWRVMATITCDDTEYGDFKLTAVDTVRSSIDGEQYLIQPQAIVGEEVEVLVCREKDKQGNVTKKFYDKSGDPIESLLDYYASKNDHITVADTGAIPFTAANISKFYSEEDLCDCLKDCLHEYAHIDDTPPCVVETCENACIYSSALQEDETEEVVQFMTGVSAVTLWGQDGLLKSRTLVEGQFQEDSSANVYIDQDALPEGWWKDETCTGIQPEGPPAECPQGQKFPVNIGGGWYHILDNSNWLGGPLPHLQNGQAYEITTTYDDGTKSVWQQTADPYFNNFIGTYPAASGCAVKSVCANHSSRKGCSPVHVANLASYPAYDSPTYPGDIQNNLNNPNRDELWATGWMIDCPGSCVPCPVRYEITNATDSAWIGAFKEPNVYKHPDILGFMVLPDDCSPAVYVDCDQQVLIPQPECKPDPWCCSPDVNQATLIKCPDPKSKAFFLPTPGRPFGAGSYQPENGPAISGATIQELEANLVAAGYEVSIGWAAGGPQVEANGEQHWYCPCDGGTFTWAGETTPVECVPNPNPEFVPNDTFALQTTGKHDEEILACLKSLKECPVCPELATGFVTDVTTGNALSLPLTALGVVEEWTQNITVDNPECLSDEVELCITIDHEAGVGGHTGFLIVASAGTFTAKSASNSIPGTFGSLGTNIISIGHNQELGNARNLRWVKLTVPKADLIAGISIQSATFGSTNATSFDRMYSIDYEITGGKENCDGC